MQIHVDVSRTADKTGVVAASSIEHDISMRCINNADQATEPFTFVLRNVSEVPIKIRGNLHIPGDVAIRLDLVCYGHLTVAGAVEVNGSIHAQDICATRLHAFGDVVADNLWVDGDVIVEGQIVLPINGVLFQGWTEGKLNAAKITTGHLIAKEIVAGSVNITGGYLYTGNVDLDSLRLWPAQPGQAGGAVIASGRIRVLQSGPSILVDRTLEISEHIFADENCLVNDLILSGSATSSIAGSLIVASITSTQSAPLFVGHGPQRSMTGEAVIMLGIVHGSAFKFANNGGTVFKYDPVYDRSLRDHVFRPVVTALGSLLSVPAHHSRLLTETSVNLPVPRRALLMGTAAE